MATKKGPAKSSAFNCAGCKKKRKMALVDTSGFFGTATYECPHCGKEKIVKA